MAPGSVEVAPDGATHVVRREELEQEAAYLHHALYGTAPSGSIVEEYVRAHEDFCVETCNDVNIRAIVQRRLDVEALELSLRRQRPALTRKLRMLVYITEAKASYYGRFVNDTDRRATAWFALTVAVLRTAYKMVKGRIVLRREVDV